MAKVAKMPQFVMRDLTRPNGQRFIHILSAIRNFRAFSGEEARVAFMENLREKSEQTYAMHEDQLREVEELNRDIQEAE